MVSKLAVRDFRCFAKLEIEFHPQYTFIVGQNALGKTSLLEAIAVLTRLQSPRTNSMAQLIRFGAKSFVTDGYVSGYHLQYYYSPNRRKMALDSVEQKKALSYVDVARVVYFANSDIDLIRGPGDGRRRFLDFMGAQFFKTYREVLRSYEKALNSRNRYLKMVPSRPREVAAYTRPLLHFGHQLTALRAFLIERLEPYFADAFAAVSDRSETPGVRYRLGATTDFEKALRESAPEEHRLRVTLIGPHRDDFQVFLASHAADVFASEGQQRTAAIALKVAQAKMLEIEFKKPPLLLLDDVFGELDLVRRNRLFSALPPGSQRLITTTHLDWLNSVPTGKMYRISETTDGDKILNVEG
jgi:DNA replication and repair protein RecF